MSVSSKRVVGPTNAYVGKWLNLHKQYEGGSNRLVDMVSHGYDGWYSDPNVISEAIFNNYHLYSGRLNRMIDIILNEHDGWSDWSADTDLSLPPVWIPFNQRLLRTPYAKGDAAHLYIHPSQEYRLLSAMAKQPPMSKSQLAEWAGAYEQVREVNVTIWGNKSKGSNDHNLCFHRSDDEFNGLLYIAKYAPISKTQRSLEERWFDGKSSEQGHYYTVRGLDKGAYLFLIDPVEDTLSIYLKDDDGPHYGMAHVATKGLYSREYRPDPMDSRAAEMWKRAYKGRMGGSSKSSFSR